MNPYQEPPHSLTELMKYCVQHADAIRVRLVVDGEVQNLPLAKIPFARAMEIIAVWFVEERWPHVVVGPEEAARP